MRLTRRMRRRTIAGAVTVVAALLLWANGVHNIGTLNAAASGGCQSRPAATVPQIPELPSVPASQRQPVDRIIGPTTAYTRASEIRPITDFAAKQQRLPVTLESDDGAQQTVTDTSRILALNQNGGLASAVIGLGLGCNLVGRDVATQVSALMPGREELPLVTQNGHELNAEAILNLAPTVVLTDTSIGPYDVQMQLRAAGIPVVFIPSTAEDGVEGVAPQIAAVAHALGLDDLGAQLAQRVSEEIRGTEDRIAELAPADPAQRPRAVFLYLRGTIYYWFGEGSGADSLIEAIGARDVASEVGFTGMSPTNAEALVKAAPDVIIVMTKGLASVGGLHEAVKLPGIAQTPAGKNRRIVDMSDYEVMSFGPRTAEVIAALGVAVHAPDHAFQPADDDSRQAHQPGRPAEGASQ
ncbi:heme/hemin ABC transporter substrate-binding protein [Brevibacterium otitidis]|uniref:Hemin ABC transporter substrate-binding protein n=1 Tax=Brevibacterium otitidis TaxID=53364 RepID=A0ABV5WXG5_9MICO